jgi:beta-glucosidase
LPLCLQRAGGWLNPATADAFAEFTRVVATALGDRVVNWMTFNEPQCFIVLGHHVGVHAPGVHYDDPDFAVATHTMLVAHGKAVSELRKIGGDRFRIGYVPTTRGFIPATESPADIEVCRELMFGFRPPAGAMWTFAAFTDPVFLGRYPDDYFRSFRRVSPGGMGTRHAVNLPKNRFLRDQCLFGRSLRRRGERSPEASSRPCGIPHVRAQVERRARIAPVGAALSLGTLSRSGHHHRERPFDA